MKKKWILGIGLLLSMSMVAPCQVMAESTVNSSEQSEVVNNEGTGGQTDELKAVEETEGGAGTQNVQGNEMKETDEADTTKKTENDAANELKIWDVIYDEEKDQITGKTEPNAHVMVVHVDTGNSNGGVFVADADGNFTCINSMAGVNRFEAYLNGRTSAPYDIEVVKKKVNVSLNIVNVTYDIKTKTIHGLTAPNATVYTYLPSTGGQGMVKVDEYGQFSVTDQFKPGTEVVLTAQDSAGSKGEPFSFMIPSEDVMNALKIRDVYYDHAAKKLTGKTAPNATVYASIVDGGQGMFQADANGNFEIKEEFKPGTVIRIGAYLDGVYSENVEYTIPEAPTSETTTTSVEKAATKPDGKKGFPKTGTTVNLALSIVGGLAVLVAGVLIITRRLAGRKG
ncbi:LPXTG cell wall anchor domain-containing protein [Candidatus Enterococcus clewellii]|uniref:Gram-positive cocci surface proteins LPxTG domain-containing protein n=1 Tax=Candidatus Enterococcus clewellii TaxID=1834193 RepID=A0A242K872_9ENTE|nr:LPXTG cell wall anchor domain-containing protein [Enterococcus sp. 9E7_DIV0242]OTP17375.1 hypothetical protein A5888_001513 [Enterococcus sp. 9E7_DIV0242]